MIVSVFESEPSANYQLLQQADLALEQTDETSWDGERMFRIIKNRFSEDDRLIKASELRQFVQQYEEKLNEVKVPERPRPEDI